MGDIREVSLVMGMKKGMRNSIILQGFTVHKYLLHQIHMPDLYNLLVFMNTDVADSLTEPTNRALKNRSKQTKQPHYCF